jgi:peptidoglycan/xylan/chitin deacetylase (PgdA/CDA1 family)
MHKVVLTVDLETDWETNDTEAIEIVLPKFLKLLKQHKAKATFFVVGELAEKFPEQIQQIIKQGHEIASHSNTHRNLKKLRFDELEKEVSDSKQTLEKLGCKVQGFRAPRGVEPMELKSILKKHNYQYNSSTIASWFPGRYNHLDKANPTKDELIELPIPNFTHLHIPAGLSYVRLFNPMFNRIFTEQPYLIYLHLHEFTNKPQSKHIPAIVRMASYRNRGDKAWKIFEKIINTKTKFITCQEYIKSNSNKFSKRLSN